jgi:hypothetical protein
VQSASAFHDRIRHARAQAPESIGDDTAALDPGDGMFYSHAHLADEPVEELPLLAQLRFARLLPWLENARSRRRIALKARVLIEKRIVRKSQPRLVSNPLVLMQDISLEQLMSFSKMKLGASGVHCAFPFAWRRIL